ncbi:MAG: DUF192 domain-containing protein [Firmicutes bacterium]|nr:DUF192 domain-containing protein [Bacillota bacterium]
MSRVPAKGTWCVRRSEDGRVVAGRVCLAADARSRMVGLLGRTSLEPDEGLWLEPCNAVHALGMRMAIDAVYLDREGRVLRVVAPLRPWRLGPLVLRARAVLELAAGAAEAAGVTPGDRLVRERAGEDTAGVQTAVGPARGGGRR